MQKLIQKGSHAKFLHRINEELTSGWKVVPGTQYTVSCLTRVVNEIPEYEIIYSMVLEKEDEITKTERVKAENDKIQDEVARWM